MTSRLTRTERRRASPLWILLGLWVGYPAISAGRFDAVSPLLAERNLDIYGRTVLKKLGLRLFILENEHTECEPRMGYTDQTVTIGRAEVRSEQGTTAFYNGWFLTVPAQTRKADLHGACSTWTRTEPIAQARP